MEHLQPDDFLESEKIKLKSLEAKMRVWGILVLSLITGVIAYLENGYLISFLFALLYTAIYWNGNVAISYWVDKKIKIDQNFLKSLYLQGLGMMVFNAIATFFIILINPFCGLDGFWTEYLESLRITAFVIVLYNSLFLFRLLQNSRVQYGFLQRAKAEIEYAGLQNQLNPHFLFNSLNTLQNLIEESPQSAIQFVKELSLCYRYILENKGKEVVSLSEELGFAQSFVHLLHIRFGDALRVEWPENWGIDGKLPPLSLQILIENSVKHNIISQSKPLYLKIYIEGQYLFVSNNLQLRRQKITSTGTGLENIAKRYALLSEKTPLVERSDKDFRVGLPVLHVNEIVLKDEAIVD